MGSSYKNSSSSSNSTGGQRGKPYALMLLLAFGAAILGLMVLHKLREKRIFSLLVKEKDHELLTLHLLFQREQELNKEARKKIEDMKTKVYSLRSQKLELDRRLLEMESTIASLRDERKVIESTLEEKKNEIKMLTEEGMNSTFPQVSSLKDLVKMKETEIEDLKLRLNKTDFAKLSSSIAETNTSGVTAIQEIENDGQRLHEYTDKEATSENVSQTDGIMRQQRLHSTNISESSNDTDNHEPQMRQEAALYEWAHDQGENTENGGILINTDESREVKTTDVRSDRRPNLGEVKTNDTATSSHDDPRDQERRDLTTIYKDGLKIEKPDTGATGLGIRVRRRHSRSKRLRDLRNRRMGENLHSVSTEIGALKNQENADSYSQKDEGRTAVHPVQSDKLNQTQDTGMDGQGGEKNEAEKGEAAQDQRSTETKPQETDAENGDDKGNSNKNWKDQLTSADKSADVATTEENARKQISDELNNRNDIDGNRKLLKMHNMDVNITNGDNEQRKETEAEEGDVHDSEDPREPEIDKADIKRFAESDPDEEEAQEAAEEPEF